VRGFFSTFPPLYKYKYIERDRERKKERKGKSPWGRKG
jgi:hypothetical protein